jgi:hypothetical protein
MAKGIGLSCMKYALFALNFLVFVRSIRLFCAVVQQASICLANVLLLQLFGGALVGVGAYATSMVRTSLRNRFSVSFPTSNDFMSAQ